MDYEDIIKLQQQSPVYSTGNNSHSLKQCMAAFYDNDSEIQHRELPDQIDNPYHISFEQAIDYVQNYVDIMDTPLEDVMLCFERLECGQGLDRNLLRKKVLKRKHMLKRYRAKTRLPKTVYSFEYCSELAATQIVETEAQIKKKRNRVSAQISRDRKKLYFKELQLKNQQLEEQIIRARLENEKLRKEAQKSEELQRPKIHSQTFNNKLTKLLIFLGIICLISILKETFFSTTESLARFKASQKDDEFSTMDRKLISQEGMAKVVQFLEDEQVGRQLGLCEQGKNREVCGYGENEGNSVQCGEMLGLMVKLDEMRANIEL